MGSVTQIRIDQVAVRNMFRSPTGPVGRRLVAQGKAIERLAKEKATKHHMEGWVHSAPLPSLYGVNILVYCDHPAAIFVLKGTKPHVIMSHGSWPLRNRRTGVVFGPRVSHPGYRGDNFLTQAMLEARI